jgi:hypothetical protein
MKKIITISLFLLFAVTIMGFSLESTHEISDKCELKSVSMYTRNVRKDSDEKLVVFDLVLKNVSQEDKSYDVTIIVEDDFIGQGSIPMSWDKKIKPDDEDKAEIAIMYNKIPSNFKIIIQ